MTAPSETKIANDAIMTVAKGGEIETRCERRITTGRSGWTTREGEHTTSTKQTSFDEGYTKRIGAWSHPQCEVKVNYITRTTVLGGGKLDSIV